MEDTKEEKDMQKEKVIKVNLSQRINIMSPTSIFLVIIVWSCIGAYYFTEWMNTLDTKSDIMSHKYEILIFAVMVLSCGPIIWVMVIKTFVNILRSNYEKRRKV